MKIVVTCVGSNQTEFLTQNFLLGGGEKALVVGAKWRSRISALVSMTTELNPGGENLKKTFSSSWN
jgi:hypothetical protein